MTKAPEHPLSSAGEDVPVVAVGASAGGLEQIRQLFSDMPDDTGAAFVVLMHLQPDRKSQLTELVAHVTDMPVITIEDDTPLQANGVHVIPAGYALTVEGNHLRLRETEQHEHVPTIIDGFFRSLAEVCGSRAVGIVLSGSGSDGALGLKAIKSCGGLTIVQNPDNAEHDGMPRTAADTAAVDYVLDTRGMTEPLCNHLRHNRARQTQAAGQPSGRPSSRNADENAEAASTTGFGEDISDKQLALILDILRAQTRRDFRNYKPAMLKRRIRRRMGLLNIDGSADYKRLLKDDREERTRLCQDFLISVTDFFREPETCETLATKALDPLIKNHGPDETIRIWVAGCATGEEAYSIAMLLDERIKASGKDLGYLVFASDIDERALETARAGVYPESISADVSQERLHTYFQKTDNRYQVGRELRKHVVFAVQSVVSDPPYSRLHLVSCRNLLIYMDGPTQDRVIGMFHFALEDGGFLYLGTSENVGDATNMFEPVVKEHRLFRRIGPRRHSRVEFPPSHAKGHAKPRPSGDEDDDRASAQPREIERIARDILLKDHVPAAVLVNRKLEILCSYGPTRQYLALPFGQSSLDLMEMVHAEFSSKVRAVTYRALRDHESASLSATYKDDDGQEHGVEITARPLHTPEAARGLIMVIFQHTSYPEGAGLKGFAESSLEQKLSDELQATQRELNNTIQALEASNEDLKGSNEEIMSMNEELQSTNEELETSKEELQSLNEELSTVNGELETKVADLETAHNDLNNLFAGTEVATLFLDRDMRIKRFTPAIKNLLNLIASDTGRPLRDMTLKFHDPDLLADADAVLDDLRERESEVKSDTGHWYLRRILPYRTRDNTINGVVMTFTDINEVKKTALAAQRSEEQLDLAINAIDGGMWDMRIDPEAPGELPDHIHLSPRLKALLGFADEQIPNSLTAWEERIVPEDRAAFHEMTRRQIAGEAIGSDAPYRLRHRDGSIRWFTSHGKLLRDESGRVVRWIGLDTDITEIALARKNMRQREEQLRLLSEVLPARVAYIDADSTHRFANSAYTEWFCPDGGEIVGERVADIVGPRIHEEIKPQLDKALAGQTVSFELRAEHPDRGLRQLKINLVPFNDDDDGVDGCYVLLDDVSEHNRRKLDRPDQRADLAYVHRMAMVGEMATGLAHDLNQPLSAINTYAGALSRMLEAGKKTEETVPVLRKIVDQVTRTTDIVRDVREFVGRRETRQDALDLNDLVHRSLSLMEGRARKSGSEVQLSIHSALPAVMGNAVQLEQVLVNLINNAFEAMESVERDARVLRVKTRLHDDRFIEIKVQDSGPGISPDKMGQIFESFHTSKLNGMGMGLAISRSIIELHGGQLWAESQYGEGATFHMKLPLMDDESPPPNSSSQ